MTLLDIARVYPYSSHMPTGRKRIYERAVLLLMPDETVKAFDRLLERKKTKDPKLTRSDLMRAALAKAAKRVP